MATTKEVKVLRSHSNEDLEQQINELLTQGFEITNTLAIDQTETLYTIMKK
jgi:ribosomal protein L29